MKKKLNLKLDLIKGFVRNTPCTKNNKHAAGRSVPPWTSSHHQWHLKAWKESAHMQYFFPELSIHPSIFISWSELWVAWSLPRQFYWIMWNEYIGGCKDIANSALISINRKLLEQFTHLNVNSQPTQSSIQTFGLSSQCSCCLNFLEPSQYNLR